jgi:hypothetical protein
VTSIEPVEPPDDDWVANRIMAEFMLRAVRHAPRGGRIRFRVIDRTEDGDRVVRAAEIATEDARRIAGLEDGS